jgi:hypothetical protein
LKAVSFIVIMKHSINYNQVKFRYINGQLETGKYIHMTTCRRWMGYKIIWKLTIQDSKTSDAWQRSSKIEKTMVTEQIDRLLKWICRVYGQTQLNLYRLLKHAVYNTFA